MLLPGTQVQGITCGNPTNRCQSAVTGRVLSKDHPLRPKCGPDKKCIREVVLNKKRK
jgi:hypothetical protein